MNGGANLFPELYVELYNAAVAHDLEKVKELQAKVMQISRTIYTQGKYGSSYLKGLKCALAAKGVCSGYIAAPFNQFDGEYEKRIEEALEAIKL